MDKEPPKENGADITPTSPLGGLGDQLDLIKFITYAVLIVLFLGFAGIFVATGAMLWDSWKAKEGAFNILNDKLDILVGSNSQKVEDEKDVRIKELEQQLLDLKAKNPYLK